MGSEDNFSKLVISIECGQVKVHPIAPQLTELPTIPQSPEKKWLLEWCFGQIIVSLQARETGVTQLSPPLPCVQTKETTLLLVRTLQGPVGQRFPLLLPVWRVTGKHFNYEFLSRGTTAACSHVLWVAELKMCCFSSSPNPTQYSLFPCRLEYLLARSDWWLLCVRACHRFHIY